MAPSRSQLRDAYLPSPFSWERRKPNAREQILKEKAKRGKDEERHSSPLRAGLSPNGAKH